MMKFTNFAIYFLNHVYFNMKKKVWSILALLFAFSAQVLAVLNEQNLDMTVSVLKTELEKTGSMKSEQVIFHAPF